MCFHLSATNDKTTMRPMQLRNLTGLERSAIKGTMLNNKDVIYVGKKINNKIKAPNITSRDLITLSL
jgi:hypothetical protein